MTVKGALSREGIERKAEIFIQYLGDKPGQEWRYYATVCGYTSSSSFHMMVNHLRKKLIKSGCKFTVVCERDHDDPTKIVYFLADIKSSAWYARRVSENRNRVALIAAMSHL